MVAFKRTGAGTPVDHTVSGATDTGADPNRLVTVTDARAATTAGGEAFQHPADRHSGEVLRGVSFTPGT